MAESIRNAYQRIVDILIQSGMEYEDITSAYERALKSKGQKGLKVDSVKKGHLRGNLPLKLTAKEFYDEMIADTFMTTESICCFAKDLVDSLDQDHAFPQKWAEQKNLIDGSDADVFNNDLFRMFVLSLFGDHKIHDEDERKRKIASMAKEGIALQRENIQATEEEIDQKLPSALEFSAGFFHAGARSVVGASDQELEEALAKLSEIFGSITHVEFRCDNQFDAYAKEKLLTYLQKYVLTALQDDCKEILKIKGPLGSYKNRLMQYLYIALERKSQDFVPIYIDISSYEKAAEASEEIDENDFKQAFGKDIAVAKAIVAAQPNKKPLLMLDGVRDFSCKNESLYYSVEEGLNNPDWYLIVCEDTDFTMNVQNKFGVHPLISNNYECYLRVRSMNLNRKQESLAFIRNCIEFFGVALPDDITPEIIYDSLVRMDFLTIDAYWLTCILRSHLTDITDHRYNIAGLYNAICVSALGSRKMVESAAEFAYEFEFGKRSFCDENPYFDLRWRLIRKHRSVLDFLIATFYMKKVSELNLERGTHEQNIEKLSFFNMVLQKSITRFVVKMLNGVDDYEQQIMIIATRYYDKLDLFGKSELTFWMARLKNKMRNMQCINLLKRYNKQELELYYKDNFASAGEKRKTAFLIRGIYVSLIYKDDLASLKEYLNSLLTDKVANSVNRGFHLEYYGDKPYIPRKTLLDFEDDVTSGEATLTVLCLSLDRRMRRRGNSSPVSVLEVMTLCNLLQARMEAAHIPDVMDVTPYIDKCIRYLEWIMPQRVLKGMTEVCVYFNWMRSELLTQKEKLKHESDKVTYNHADVFNKFGHAASVKRTGWVERNIPHPENIVEHMYNCWLIGLLYLPNTYSDPEYNKNDILQMLLLHDLAEAQTGDISRPIKNLDRSTHDRNERNVMQSLFLSGTYPGAVDLSQYMNLWNNWSSRGGINYQVAKDIDNLQTIYQFCDYYLNNRQILDEDQVFYWMSGLDTIETDIGKNIADVLIVNNPLYKEIMEVYNSGIEQ